MGDEVKDGTRKFEPPPWELEAFEALARKRAEEQAVLDAIALAAIPTAETIAPVVEAAEVAQAPLVTEPVAAASNIEQKADHSVPDKAEAPVVDERQVQAMLMELSREETADSGKAKMIVRVAALITALVGVGMLIGGVMAIRTAGGTAAGAMGSGALSVFGLCFMAMAVWVWVGSNRAKGSR